MQYLLEVTEEWKGLQGAEVIDGKGNKVILTLLAENNISIFPTNQNTHYFWYQGDSAPTEERVALSLSSREQNFATYDGIDNFFVRCEDPSDMILIIT